MAQRDSRRRERRDYDDGADDRPRRNRGREPSEKSNAALLWTLLGVGGGAVILIVIILIVALSGGREPAPLAQQNGKDKIPSDAPTSQVSTPSLGPKEEKKDVNKKTKSSDAPGPGKKNVEVVKQKDEKKAPIILWRAQGDPGPDDLTQKPMFPEATLFAGPGATLITPTTPSSLLLVKGAGKYEVYDLFHAKRLSSAPISIDLVGEIVSPDGQFVLGRQKIPGKRPGDELYVVSLQDGSVVKKFDSFKWSSADFLPDGLLLVGTERDSKGPKSHLEVMEMSTGKVLAKYLPRSWAGSILSTGRKYAIGNRIWLARTGQIVGELKQFPNSLKKLAISPDGQEVAAFCNERTKDGKILARIMTWKMSTGEIGVDHIFSENFSAQLGPRLVGLTENFFEWLPDRSGWLLAGQILVDYSSGAVVHERPAPAWRLLGPDFLLVRREQAKADKKKGIYLDLSALPRQEIAAAVAKANASAVNAPTSLPAPNAVSLAHPGKARSIHAPWRKLLCKSRFL
jgi:hypothetical protein